MYFEVSLKIGYNILFDIIKNNELTNVAKLKTKIPILNIRISG